ncbi:MAG: fibronectin type III domain-containing protein [Burkholderiales bacterium]|nr:fibronectin type III domain-containing protein [Burkholderiales bacterium]
MHYVIQRWTHSLCAVIFFVLSCHAAAGALPRFNADPVQVTVSGISSGGAMAVQAHVAYSGTFKGAAIFAGAAYYCAQGNLAYATARCMEPLSSLEIPVAELASTTRLWASQGFVDNTAYLANSKVYLFSGTLDQTVRQPGMDALRDYYLNFVNPSNIVYNNQTAAGHGWISLLGPVLCAAQQSPYVNNCNLDPQQTFFSMFYGQLNAKQTGQLSGQFTAVDQTEFVDDRNPNLHGLDTNAWLYVPASCARGELCRVHVSYHGCNQSFNKIGDQFIRMSGLNEWADTNNIIVLYPQVFPSLVGPVNGQGCWDWWGYDDPDYAKKSGRQLLMTKRMVDRITSGYAPVAAPQNLQAAHVSTMSVKLRWSPVNNATGYKIYRDGMLVGSTSISSNNYGTVFVNTGLMPGTAYTYTVRALAGNGNVGPASASLTVSTR